MTPARTRAPARTLRPPYPTSSTLAAVEPANSHRRGITRPQGRTRASASRLPAASAAAAASAASTRTAPPLRANCATYPPTVLTRPCPPTAQYRLTSAYANATIAAAYAAAVPAADQPEAAGADGARSTPGLPITLQY